MSTTTLKRPQSLDHSVEDARASLVKRFIAKIENIPDALISDAVKLKGDKALVMIVKADTVDSKKLSVRARNEIAFAKLKANAFEIVKQSYDFIESGDVCAILNISRQALSKKMKAGQVIAYTNGRRKYYPDFQFKNNEVKPEIGFLTKALSIDTLNEPLMNVLIGFLAQTMDFYGGSDNEQPRYSLLENEDALNIIVRDFQNRLEMGK